MAENNQMKVQITGNPEHLDDLLPMLQPQAMQAASSLGMPSAPPPAAPPVLGSRTLGMIPASQESAAVESLPANLPNAPRTKLGEVGHILGTIGQVAGSALIPHVMPWIPGTEQHKLMEQDIASRQKAEQADLGMTGAKTDYYESEAYKNFHPMGKGSDPEEAAFDALVKNGTPPIDAFRQIQDAKASGAWKAVPDANLEISGRSGETRPLGTPQDQGKPPEDKIKNAFDLWLKDPAKFAEWAKAQQGLHPGNRGMMSPYAVARIMDYAYRYDPRLMPLIPGFLNQLSRQLGIQLPNIDLSGPPAGQPRGSEGQAIGLSQPEAPTGTVKTRGQMAEDVLLRIPNIESLVSKMESEGKLGPGAGRINDLITGKIGAGDPDFKALRDQMETLASSFSRLHLNTEKGLKPFFDMLDSGKLTPDNLRSGINTIKDWSQTYVYTGSGRQPDLKPGTSGGAKKPWERYK